MVAWYRHPALALPALSNMGLGHTNGLEIYTPVVLAIKRCEKLSKNKSDMY